MYTELKELTAQVIINKLNSLESEENYSIINDKEFYYLSGLVYSKLKFLADESIIQSSVFINIEAVLRKEYTEDKVKQVTKKAWQVVANKISLDNKIGLLIAGILGYNTEDSESQETVQELFLKGQLQHKFLIFV